MTSLSAPSDAKLRGMVDTPEGWDAIQRDPDKLKKWLHGNLMRFKKTECMLQHLDQGNRNSQRISVSFMCSPVLSPPPDCEASAYDIITGDDLIMNAITSLARIQAVTWIKCILWKFPGDMRLCGAVDREERDAIQRRNLDVLERWAIANIMKFKNGKCKVYTWVMATTDTSTSGWRND
ncbi:hypothetical protein DUI87_10189 [Hirundo rustica rustica]|uniref:Rna-directed dna polymerase from mobile element jockey-like n=1 Tax=Hirundo rustica rustica TaxID=333673 RepID=A0A3M0KHV3_HIRRU|nr:hypothetical protein DUI87_10189 [Hirundo rustica rustica]